MAVRVSSPILVGRSTELERLTAGLALARSGTGGTILVAGEAGVGKTRLVGDFADLARDDGALVLLGGCIDLHEGALPYGPIVEALRGLVRRTPGDELEALLGTNRSELARLVPDLGAVPDGTGSGLGIGSGQGRLFELLLGVLERLAARAPLAFIAEDLHWSDRSTRDLLAFLVRNLRDAPVLLLFTYRSDELHRRHPLLPFLAELERTDHVERIELRPFDRRDAASQLRAIAGRDLDASLVESIHTRSGGNAFFAEELLLAAGDDGRAVLPSTLRDVLLARVADLSEPTQGFLRVASAAGQRVDPTLVAAASGMSDTTVYDALRECVGRQVLVPDPTAGIERYAFRHALLQEAVYEDLLPGERTRLHSTFARILESRWAGDPSYAAELAYHWYAAHDLPRALEWAVTAGHAAEAAYAFPEARSQFERAIELWDQVPDAEARAGRDRIDLLAELAAVARFQDPAASVATIEAAIHLADESADPIRGGLLNERLGRYAWSAGQGERANAAYRTAIRLIPPEPPSEARARAVAGLAQILTLGGHFEESRAFAEEALDLARAVGAREIEGHALNTRGLDRCAGGDVDGAIDDLRAALAIAEAMDVVDDIGRAYANWIWVYDSAGRLEEAVALAEVGVAMTERLGLVRFFGTHMLCGVADYLYRLGRWDESERAVRRAEEIGPFGINEILVQEMLGRLAMAHGDLDGAADRLLPLGPLAERAVDVQFVGPVQASLAELALWQGRPGDAAVQIAATIRQIDFSPEVKIGELYALGLRANADAAERARAHRSPDAEEVAVAAGDAILAGIRERHAQIVALRPAFESLSGTWLLLCEAESTRLHRRPDPDAWGACADAWQQLGRPYVVAYARWREAEARLAARSDRGTAAAALRSARDIAERLGAALLLREVTALAARGRLNLDRAAGEADERDDGAGHGEPDRGRAGEAELASSEAPDLGLTVREREVLALVALGHTNRQIADELFISPNTAGVHVSNILGKLDVNSRGEAAAIAYRLGLVPVRGDSRA